MTFCTERNAIGAAPSPSRASWMFLRSARLLVDPKHQHPPQYWGMCWFRIGVSTLCSRQSNAAGKSAGDDSSVCGSGELLWMGVWKKWCEHTHRRFDMIQIDGTPSQVRRGQVVRESAGPNTPPRRALPSHRGARTHRAAPPFLCHLPWHTCLPSLTKPPTPGRSHALTHINGL